MYTSGSSETDQKLPYHSFTDGVMALLHAKLQILIPSFPWIVQGGRAWGLNPRKGRDQILPSGNLEGDQRRRAPRHQPLGGQPAVPHRLLAHEHPHHAAHHLPHEARRVRDEPTGQDRREQLPVGEGKQVRGGVGQVFRGASRQGPARVDLVDEEDDPDSRRGSSTCMQIF